MIPSFKYKLVTYAQKHLALGKMLEFKESNNPVFNYEQLFADPNSVVWTRNGVRLELSSYLAHQG